MFWQTTTDFERTRNFKQSLSRHGQSPALRVKKSAEDGCRLQREYVLDPNHFVSTRLRRRMSLLLQLIRIPFTRNWPPMGAMSPDDRACSVGSNRLKRTLWGSIRRHSGIATLTASHLYHEVDSAMFANRPAPRHAPHQYFHPYFAGQFVHNHTPGTSFIGLGRMGSEMAYLKTVCWAWHPG